MATTNTPVNAPATLTAIPASARVVRIDGKAYIQIAEGQLMALKPGDLVKIGQQLVVDEKGLLVLGLDGGQTLDIGGGRSVLADEEMLLQALVGRNEAALSAANADAARVAAALASGADPFAALDPTAAGVTGVGGDQQGHGFVRLLRIAEGFDGYNFTRPAAAAQEDFQQRDGVAGQRDDERVPEDDDPVTQATADTTVVNEDQPVTFLLTGNDVSGSGAPLVVTSINGTPVTAGSTVSIPTGTVTLNADGSVTFVPTPNYNGPANFNYTVSDGTTSSSAQVTVSVQPVNDAPVATADTANTTAGTPVTIDVLANDSDLDGDALRVTAVDGQPIAVGSPVSLPQGVVSLNPDGTLSFQPTPGFTGNTGFSYTVADPSGATSTSTVAVGVAAAVTASVSLSATPAVAEGGNITYTATLSSAAVTPVTVTLNTGETITIAAGQTTGSVVLAAPSDDVYVDAGNVSRNISAASGGGFSSVTFSNTPVTTTVSDTVDATTVSLSASPSVAEGGSIVYTATLTSAAQTPVTVTLDNGLVITIVAGATIGNASVAAPTDDVYLDAGSVSARISTASGGNFENLVVNGTPAATSITDTPDTTTVSLTATPAVAEGGSITYTATLTAPAQSAVTVTLSNGATITIAAGASSGSVAFAAPTDDVYLDAGNVSATITGATGGNFENLAVNGTPAVTAVSDTVDTTTVSLSATPAVAEGGNIIYTASLTSAAQSPVTVTLTGGIQITIAAGASTGSVTVPAPANTTTVDAGTVSRSITSAAGGNFESLAVDNTPATTNVSDTIDTTTVSLTATPSVAEGGNITYTASLTSVAQTAVTVTLDNGVVITIAANSSTGSVTVPAPTDDVYLDAGSVARNIASATGGNFENLVVDATPASTSVSDTPDTTTVSLTASSSVSEGGNITYTASLTAPAQSAVTITLSNGAVITIAANASSGSVSVPAPADDVYAGSRSVSATIATASGGNFESLVRDTTPATTTVTDVPTDTTVSLTASPSVSEGGQITYTASLTSPATSAVTVTLSNGATITIPANSSSGSVSVAAPADDVYVDAGNVSATIATATGGGFENLVRDTTPATTAVSDTPDNTTVSLTASPNVAEGGNITYTASLTAPAQSAVTVTLSNGAVIIIPANASSGSVSVAAPADDVYVDAGSVSATIANASGGNFENLVVNGTAASTTITDTPDTTTVSLTASPSVAEGGSIVYTASLTSAAQSPVTVTLSNGAVITIATGDTSGSVSFAAPTDDVYVDAGNVSATIATATGGNFENLVRDTTPATTAVTDTLNTTTVSITGAGSIAEGASGQYTVSLTSNAQTDVTVTLTYSGTAADGSDFTGVATITIPAGSSSANFSIAAIDDVLAEGAESFTVSIATATGGNFENLAISGTAGSVTTGIVDNDTPTLAVSDTSVVEGGYAVFTVSLSNPSATAISFNPSLASGTATVGTDTGTTLEYFNGTSWVAVGGAGITLAAGETSVQVRVATTDDPIADSGETFTLTATVTAGVTGNSSATGTATITDEATAGPEDTTTVSLSATSSVAEGGQITYTATLTNPANAPLTVTLSNGTVINIAAGSTTGSTAVAAPTDDVHLDAGNVSATIASTSGGAFENLVVDSTPASTSVTDTIDITTVSLTATSGVAEGGQITYTASLNNPAQTAVTVTLQGGLVILIAAGASQGSATVAAPADDVHLDAGSVSDRIATAVGGNFESLVIDNTPAVTTVSDTLDDTTVSLTATPSVAEGGSIIYTASLTSAAQTAVTVTLSNGATITIAAGQSTGTVSVAAPADDAIVDAGNVSATITGASGGNFENLLVDSTPATTAVTDTLTTTTVTLTASNSVAEGGNITYTASLTSAADTPVTITLSNGAVINIAAGASTGSVSFAAPTDDVYVDAGSVSATISSATGGNFENLVVNPAAATTTITDTPDTTTVTLTASGSVAEGGQITYTASLTSAAGTAVTITLSNGAVINIAAGASSGSVSFAAPTDDVYVDAGSVSATISNATGGNFENLAVNTAPAVTTITDTPDITTVSLTASGSVAEGGNITYTASLTSAAQSPVTVTLSNGAVITIAAGSATGSVSFAAPTDDVYVDAGSVSATISSATGGNFENLAINPAAATTTITDTPDNTTVSLTASNSVAEGGQITYTANLTSAAQSAVTVTLSNGAVINIAAGASSGSVTFPAPTDDVYVDAGNVSATISTATGGNFENLVVDSTPASTTVTDTPDTTTVSLTASNSVAEGGQITYTASLTSAAQSTVTVTLSNGAVITIAAGDTTGSTTHAAPTDDVYVDAGSVSATIATATGGNFENLSINPAAASTTVTDTPDNTTVSLSATPSVAEGGSIIYTASLTSAAQSAVTVTLSNGAVINIAAGQSTGTVSVPAPADDVYLDAGNVSATISSATGGNFENLVVNGAAATTSVTDTVNTTTVSLTGSGSVVEGGSASYTVSLTSAAQTDVTVSISYSGTAADGSDYTGVATVTIPAGSSSASFSIATIDDAFAEGSESIVLSLGSASGGNFENLVISGSAGSVTTTLVDNDGTPSITVSDISVSEGGLAVFTVGLSNLSATPVTFNPVLASGTAIVGTDTATALEYFNGTSWVAVTPAGITIPAGESAVQVRVATTDDALAEGSETFTLTANVSAGTTANTSATGTATISDEATPDTVLVSIAGPGAVNEGDSTGNYTVSLGQAAVTPVTVTLNYSGTATNGSDYTGVVSVTIPAGATSITFNLATIDDALADSGETIVVSLGNISGGGFEAIAAHPTSNSVTTTISDEATPHVTTVSLSATPTVAEGGAILYTATLNNAAASPVSVTLSTGQVITIAAGALTGTLSIAAPADDPYLDAGNVSRSIASASGGGLESLQVNSTPAVTSVTDTLDTTTVSLSASGSVVEGSTVTYTASVNAPVTGSPVTVTLSNGSSIIINVGQSSGSISLPVANNPYAGGGSLSASITGASGGNYENLAVNNTPATTTVTDSTDTTSVTLSAAGSVGEGGSVIYTATVSNAVTGSPLVVTLSNGQTITIPVGATSADSAPYAVRADDPYVQGNQTLTVSINGTTGGNYEALNTSSTASTAVTDDGDVTTVTLSAAPSVVEGGSIVYTAAVNNAVTGAPLVITLSNGQTITIPVGSSSAQSTPFAVRADDAQVQGNQTVSASITGTTGGNYEALNTSSTASTTVTDDADATTVTLTSSAASVTEGGSIIYTASVDNPVAGSPLVITLSNGQTITIPVGSSSAQSTPFAVRGDDAYVQGNQTLNVSVSNTSGGNYEALTTTSTTSTTVTDDADATTVTLTASTSSVGEGGSIVYTATVNNAVTGSPLVITLNNGQTITIPVGSSSAQSAAVAVRGDDAYVQGNQTVTASITGTTGGNYEALTTSSTASTTVTDDADATTVTLTASASNVTEGGSIVYTATVNNAVTGTPLVITLDNGQTITIPVGSSSAQSTPFAVRPDDAQAQGNQTLTVGISNTSGGNYEALTTSSTATTTVSDDADATTVTLSASAASVTEGGSIIYTATVSNAVAGTPLVVTLSNGQTITIPVGATSAQSTPFAVRGDDAYVQGNQTLTVSIGSTSGGNYEALTTSSTASTTVSDDADVTTVTLTSSASSVTEGSSIVYTATVNNPVTGSPLVVTLSNGQTITIPVGSSSAQSAAYPVRADDAQVQGNQTVTASITGTTGGNYEALNTSSTTSTTVTDDADATTVTLTASAASVTEGGSIIYTATVSNAVAGTPLVITLNNGQVITIPVGQTSAQSAAVAVRGDDAYVQGNQTVTASITGTTGGNYEALTTSSTASTTVTDDADATTVTLTASSASVVEGGSIIYTAAVNNAVTGTPLVITLSNGQTITIPVGSSSAQSAAFAVRADDAQVQGNQTLTTSITGTSGGNYEALTTSSTASTTVTDDADVTTVTLTASSANVTEGGSIVYTATVNNVVAGSPLVVTLSNGQTITIPVGASSANSAAFAVRADDVYAQGNQTVTTTITGTTGGNYEAVATSGSPSTVVSDDSDTSTINLSAGPASITEGNSGTYTLTLSSAAQTAVTVTLSYSGTAANGTDYTGVATVTIPAGASSATFDIATLDDAFAESGESFTVSIGGTSGGGFENLAVGSSGSITTSIVDEATPDTVLVSIAGPGSVTEGATTGNYTVSLSQPAVTAVTVTLNYGGTATGGGSDYTGVVTVTIPAGSSSATFTLPTTNDTTDEPDETIVVSLGGITGGGFEAIAAHPSNNSVTTTIVDNDAAPTISGVSSPSANEGSSLVYNVTLSNASSTATTHSFSLGGGSASATDYGAPSFSNGVTLAGGVLTVPAGVTSFTVTLPTTQDTLDEINETVPLTVGGQTGTGTIVDDDATPSLAINDVSVNESAGTMTFTVTLSAASGQTVTVNYATSNGTATAGSDYTATSGTLSFAPGQTTLTITVPITNDTVTEATETLNVTLSNPSNATIADGSGVGSIVDNDAPPALDLDANNSSGATGANYTVGYTEQAAGVSIADADVAITDPDGGNVAGATVVLTNRQAGDVLNLGSLPSGITANVNTTAGQITITLSGSATPADYQTALRAITFANGSDTPSTTPRNITVTLTDGFNNSNTATTTINVTPVNDAPETNATSASGNEDTLIAVTLSGSDVDGTVTGYVISTTPANGTLYRDAAGTQAIAAGDVVSGPVYFRPSTNWNGNTSFQYAARDNDSATDATPAVASINVVAVNDAPVNLLPPDATLTEDVSYVFNTTMGGVSDVDSSSLTTTLTASHGTITLGSTAGVTVTGNGTGTVVITGSPSAINNALNGAVLAPTPDYNGPATVTVVTSDGSLSDTDVINLTITPVADIANDTVAATEDSPVTINALANDSFEDSGRSITAINGNAITAGGPAVAVDNGSVTLNASGQLVFTPTANYNGAANFTYTVTAGGTTETATVTVNVAAVNDAPINAVPGAQTINEDTSRVFSNANGNAITVSDIDSPNLTTTLSVANGVLTLGSTAGVTVTGNGSGTVTVSGSQAAINAALNGLSFTPAANYNGSATISIVSSDGSLTDTDSVVVNINPVADPTVTTADTLTVAEDSGTTAGNVLANDTDPDGPLSVSQFVVSGTTYTVAAGGSATATLAGVGVLVMNSNGSYTFTPAANYNGSVPTVTYTATDGTSSATSTLNISVTPVADPTVTAADTLSIAEDSGTGSGNVLSNDSDADGPLRVSQFVVNGTTYTVAAGGASTATLAGVGVLVMNSNGTYTFTPAANYNGSVPTVTYTATDGTSSATSTLNITVTPVADPTVTAPDTLTVAEDSGTTSGNVLTNDSDPEGPLSVSQFVVNGSTYTIAAGGSSTATLAGVGVLVMNSNGSYTFTPAANYNGSVPTVTYTATDGTSSATNTLNITVTAVDDAFTDADESVSVNEDNTLTGSVLTGTSSVDGPVTVTTFSVAGVAGTFNAGQTATITGVGTINIAANGGYTFTPVANYNGAVPVITYTMTDGSSGDTSTLTINVTPVADPTVTAPDTLTVAEDSGTTNGNVLSNDSDPDGPLRVSQFVVNGTTYTVAAGGSSTATLAGVGVLVMNSNGSYSFTPAANYNGSVPVVTYTATDGTSSATNTLSITVTAVADPTVTAPDTLTIAEDSGTGSGNVLGNDSDADGPIRVSQFVVNGTTYAVAAGGANTATLAGVGTLVMNSDGSYTFTPVANYNGSVPTVTYTATDGTSSATNTLNITVTPVNDAPVAQADTNTTAEDTTLTVTAANGVLANDSDVDGNTLTVTQFTVAGVAGTFNAGQTATITGVGTLTLNSNGSYSFVPAANYNGAVPVVTYTVSDGTVTTTSTLTLNVTPVADPTVTAPDTLTVAEDSGTTSGNVLSNDSDPDGPLRVSQFVVNGTTYAVASGSSSTATLAGVGVLVMNSNGTYTFTPAANYNGSVPTVTYTATDGTSSATSTLNITVTAVNDVPVAQADTNTTAEDTTLTVTAANGVLANDSDVDGNTLTVTQFTVAGVTGTFTAGQTATIAGVGALTLNSNGSYSFVPAANYNGSVPVATYTVSDGTVTTTGTLTLNVTPVADPTVTAADTLSIAEDSGTSGGNVLTNDSDPDGPLRVSQFVVNGTTYTVAAGGSGTATLAGVGVLVMNSNGSYTFAPAADYNGSVPTVTYTATDGTSSATNTLNITVTPVDDAFTDANETVTIAEDSVATGSVLTGTSSVDGPVTVTSFVVAGVSGTFNAGQTATISGVGTINIAANGNYTFTPVANYNGTVPTITYTMTDGSSGDTSTLNITVTAVNDAPTTTGGAVSGTEDSPLVFSWAQFNVTDVDSGPAPAIRIGSLPADGVLQYYNGSTWVSATLNQLVSQADIAAGRLRFVPDSNESGADGYGGSSTGNRQADYASFTYTPVDGSAANATGNTATMRVDITPVADAPTLSMTSGVPVTHTQITVAGGSGTSGGFTIIDGVVQISSGQRLWQTADFASSGGNANGTTALGDIFVFTQSSNVNGVNGNGALATDARDYIVLEKPRSAYTITYATDHNGAYNGYDNVVITDNATGKSWGVANNIEDIIFGDGTSFSGSTSVTTTVYDTWPVNLATALTDVDGSETLSSITITGLASGVTFSAGSSPSAGTWVLTPAQLAGLTMNVPTGTASMTLTASVTSTEALGGSATTTVNLTVYSAGTPVAANDNFNTQMGTPITITSGQLLANDTLYDGATITGVSTASGGTLVNNGNGTWTYTPSSTGTGNFTYTITDSNGQTSTATASITTYQANNDLITVHESALSGGTGGGNRVISGNLLSNDGVGGVSISSVGGVADGSANDTDARAGYVGYNHVVGGVTVGNVVVDVTGAGVGDYTYTLLNPANHSAVANNNSLTSAISYTSNLGTASLQVTIVDDRPQAFTREVEVTESNMPSYNLVLVLDISRSMTLAEAGGQIQDENADGSTSVSTRLDLAKQAMIDLVTEYFDQASSVAVKIVTFGPTGTILNGGSAYTDKATLIAAINAINVSSTGGTNYEAGLASARTAFGTPGSSTTNISYFISDGAPTSGNTNTAVSSWDSFTSANGVKSYAIGVGTGIASSAALNTIHNVDADNSGSRDSAIIVPDLNDLSATLTNSVPVAYGGNVVGSASSGVGSALGADGGYIQSVTLQLDTNADGVPNANVTFTYNASTNQISWTGGYPSGSPITGDTLSLTSARGFTYGTLNFNFATGNYTYYTGSAASEGDRFSLSFVARDGDGDVTPATNLNFSIVDGKPVARPDFDTLTPNSTSYSGNVVSGLGTDSGLNEGTLTTDFTSRGPGADTAVDGARVSSIVFQGQTFNLTTNAGSTSALGGTYTVSNGQLTWTHASNGSSLVFNRDGYYNYAPPTASRPNPGVDTTTTVNLNSAPVSTTGVSVSGRDENGNAATITYYNPSGTSNDGAGVTGRGVASSATSSNSDTNNRSIDGLETMIFTFSTAIHMHGVEGISFTVNVDNSNLGDTASVGGSTSLSYAIYHIDGHLLGTFVSQSEGLVTLPSQYSNVGRIEVQASSDAEARITDLRFQHINDDASTSVIAPTEIGYTLTDSDGDTSSSTLTLRSYNNATAGDDAGNTLTGSAINDQLFGLDGNDTLSGLAGHDLLDGGLGNDTLYGGDGNDFLFGGAGNDVLDGGAGNDRLVGGAGNDTLTGGTGSDVFVWTLADRGAPGTPAIDTITDFNNASPAAGGDVLDLRDLLQGEQHTGTNPGTLSNYLHFETSGGNTTVQISSSGGFSSGYNTGAVDQTIVLQGVDLTGGGTLNDNTIIQNLLNNNKLQTD